MQRVRISFPETSSFGNGAQARENVRNSLGFNYKSATLSDRVTGTQCSDSLLFGARRGPLRRRCYPLQPVRLAGGHNTRAEFMLGDLILVRPVSIAGSGFFCRCCSSQESKQNLPVGEFLYRRRPRIPPLKKEALIPVWPRKNFVSSSCQVSVNT